jgi:hypothetical protein
MISGYILRMCSVSLKKRAVKKAAYFNNCFTEQQFLRATRNKLAFQQVLVVLNRTISKCLYLYVTPS